MFEVKHSDFTIYLHQSIRLCPKFSYVIPTSSNDTPFYETAEKSNLCQWRLSNAVLISILPRPPKVVIASCFLGTSFRRGCGFSCQSSRGFTAEYGRGSVNILELQCRSYFGIVIVSYDMIFFFAVNTIPLEIPLFNIVLENVGIQWQFLKVIVFLLMALSKVPINLMNLSLAILNSFGWTLLNW